MADSEEVLKQLALPDDVEIIGIVVNEKGAERAIATGRVMTLGYPCSNSETFLRRNQNQSLQENLEILHSIKRCADECKVGMVAYVSMAFGNPYGDPWNEPEIRKTVAQITALGVEQISLADTVGVATPELIRRVVRSIMEDCRDIEIGVHLHGTRADAAAKVLAAYDAGCRRFDSAIGGLGGCPFAQDALVGNIPTETVLNALAERDVDLPPLGKLETVSAITAQISSRFA